MGNLEKYNLKNARRVASLKGIQGVISYFGTVLNQMYYRRTNHNGVTIMKEDWDMLLILDGCRYDLFKKNHELKGDLSCRTSRGSESLEFIESNFVEEHNDTVYVTANPFAREISEGTFHAMWNLLETEWDPKLQTVPPKAISSRLIEARRKFPRKRLIGHYMQPHYPFIGEAGRKIRSGGISPDANEKHNSPQVWTRLQYGLGVTQSKVWEAYAENLNLVLRSVDELLSDISGKVILTSDHGNLVGDRCWPVPTKGYGHPRDLYVEPLVKVPWFEIPYTSRWNVVSDPPKEEKRLEESDVQSRLNALGYR